MTPELFFEHGGVSVYHTYKHNELSYGPSGFWFTLCDDVWNDSEFDIRDLDKKVFPDDPLLEKYPPYLSDFPDKNSAAHKEAADLWQEWYENEESLKKRILKEAIDRGLLRAPSEEAA
jgi:hypothetical protein